MKIIGLRKALDVLGLMAVCAPLAVATAAISGHDHRWVDIIAQFTTPTLTATVIATLLAVCLRLRMTVLAGLFASICLMVSAWPQWFPDAAAPQPDSPVISVYSANLWARNTDVDRMRASIFNADADIVLLVEVGNAPSEQLETLLETYPHRHVSRPGNLNVAPARVLIASRWPLRPISENTDDRLSALAAIAETPLGDVGVMSVHLTRPWPYMPQWAQINQVNELADIRPQLGANAIIAGDFNSVSSSRIGRQVQQTMSLSPAPARLGTWPTFLPSILGITIDQVWHSPSLAITERRLGVMNGSDHRPVITRFKTAQ